MCKWLVLLFLALVAGAAPAFACGSFFQCVGAAAGQAVSGAGQVAQGAVNGVGQLAGGAVKVVGGVAGGVVGAVAPEAGRAISDGANRLGNNVQQGTGTVANGVAHIADEAGKQVAENPIGVLISVLYPPAAPFVLGAPTIGQAIACSLSEHLSAKESCDVGGTLSSLSQQPVATLGEVDMDVAPLTTLFKCLGIEGWLNTGCDAVGSGRPVREAQHSQDGFWTIDVQLDGFNIRSQPAQAGRFIRLEVRPNRPAHGVASAHLFTHADHMCFGGPVLIDKGKWLEVHPIDNFGICPESLAPAPAAVKVPVPALDVGGQASPALPADSQNKTRADNALDASLPDTHIVKEGECLAQIAERYYGKQNWLPIYRANQKKIKKSPDLIYPGQEFVIPRP